MRQVADLQPDVVVMDVTMPELNGIEATYQIHQNWPQMRVIILSMHASTEHIVRALQAGACGYLLKDSAGMEVAEAVRSVVTGRRYLSQKISDKVIDEYVRHYDGRITTNPLDRLSPRERKPDSYTELHRGGTEIHREIGENNMAENHRFLFILSVNLCPTEGRLPPRNPV